MRQNNYISFGIRELKRAALVVFPSVCIQILACAAMAQRERRARSTVGMLMPLASFLPTRMEPGGCLMLAPRFNLCFCPVYVENTHLNRHGQYHTLTQTQQCTIRNYAHFSITDASTP